MTQQNPTGGDVPKADREQVIVDPASRRGSIAAMMLLTFSTGIIDAVGYLGLDKVFTGNMTGNVVILGMGLTGAEGLPVAGPALALACFMLGAAVGGRTLVTAGSGWHRRMTVLYVVQAVILAGLGTTMCIATVQPDTALGFTVTGAMAFAMGMQAANARSFGVKDVTTVVVTSTITGLAADSRLAGGAGTRGWRRLLAVVLIAAGASVGALCLHVSLGLGVLLCAAITLVAAVLGTRTNRRDVSVR